jgi:hypothetical protein
MDNTYATGFIISDNCYILTSAHCFEDCYENNDISINAHINKYSYEVCLVAMNKEKDIALLKGDFTVSKHIDLGCTNNNKCTYAYIFGNSYGENIITKKVQINELQINICTETKSYIGAIFNGEIVQGYSGAPVIGNEGTFLGMVIGKSIDGDVIYALSSNEINTFVEANI